jgi:hypothetical protein
MLLYKTTLSFQYMLVKKSEKNVGGSVWLRICTSNPVFDILYVYRKMWSENTIKIQGLGIDVVINLAIKMQPSLGSIFIYAYQFTIVNCWVGRLGSFSNIQQNHPRSVGIQEKVCIYKKNRVFSLAFIAEFVTF